MKTEIDLPPAGTASGHVDHFVRQNLPTKDQWPVFDYSNLPEGITYPSRLNCGRELLDRAAETGAGQRKALYYLDAVWTYGELNRKANQIAHVLVDVMGLLPGQRVLLRGANSPMLIACWFAVVKAGGVCVSTMPLLRAFELGAIIDKAQIGLALCDIDAAEEMRIAQSESSTLADVMFFSALGDTAGASLDVAAETKDETFDAVDTSADDPVIIAFTSGTTGAPKGTVHFHREIMAITDCFPRHIWNIKPDHIFCGTPPIAFTFGLGASIAIPIRFGASIVLLSRPTPEAILDAIEKHHVTDLFTAPTMYRRLGQMLEGRDISSLQRCNSAGEALLLDDWKNWHHKTGLAIVDQLGSTEMLHNFISAPLSEQRPGSMGKPVQGFIAKVIDAGGNPVKPGVIGRLAVRGPLGCLYLANEEKQLEYVQDGWNVTGDLVHQDDDGYFWHAGRGDDLIVSSGYNISAVEVERVLMRHEAVADCAIIGVANEARGQIVKAFVVVADAIEADEALVKSLQSFVKAEIAPYKYPRDIAFLTEIPKTETGKIQRFKLKKYSNKDV